MAIRPTKQEQHSEEIRNRIMKEASRMFREYGFEKVSVRDIAAEVGVTTGTLYHHFKNKQELFVAIGSQNVDFMDALLDRFAITQQPLEDLVDLLARIMTERVLEEGYEFTQYRVLHSMCIGRGKGRLDRCVETLVRRAIELGELPKSCDAEKTTDDFLWLYRGVIYRYCLSQPPIDLQEQMTRAVRIGIRGIQHSDDMI